MARHAETRKRFQNLYSMTSLVSYEPFVDECADIFSQRLTEIAQSGKPINMGHWFQCYAFDVIACITYSRRFGFLDSGEDIDGTIAALDRTMTYSTLVGIYAKLHPVLFHLSAKLPGSGAQGRLYLMDFVQKQIDARKSERKTRDVEKGHASSKQQAERSELPEDFLEKIMNANEADPEKVTQYHIFMMGLSNIIGKSDLPLIKCQVFILHLAGSDTTAVSLSAILYHLLHNPQTLQKLRQEIKTAEQEGRCGNPEVKFRESQELPYLQAVIKEALRMHPATGLPLWRVVPAPGAEISGHYFPGGTTIGVNTWVAHNNPSIFPQPEEFRPERWIEASPEQLKKMDAYWMPFGLGSRTCLGKHISLLEIGKLIPRLVRNFDFELVRGERWETSNYWFVKPSNFEVKVKVAKEE
jgi:cytochrome P450